MEVINAEIALSLRDWIKFRNDNFLYKEKVVSRVVNQWKDTRKKLIKKCLSATVQNKTTVNAWQEIMDIYNNLIPQIEGPIITSDGTYTNFILIKKDEKSSVYSAVMHLHNVTFQVIVKSYIFIIRNIYIERMKIK